MSLPSDAIEPALGRHHRLAGILTLCLGLTLAAGTRTQELTELDTDRTALAITLERRQLPPIEASSPGSCCAARRCGCWRWSKGPRR